MSETATSVPVYNKWFCMKKQEKSSSINFKMLQFQMGKLCVQLCIN